MIPDPADYLVVAMTALYRLYLAADAGWLVVRGLAAARVNGDEVVAARNRIVEHEFKMAVLHLQHARHTIEGTNRGGGRGARRPTERGRGATEFRSIECEFRTVFLDSCAEQFRLP